MLSECLGPLNLSGITLLVEIFMAFGTAKFESLKHQINVVLFQSNITTDLAIISHKGNSMSRIYRTTAKITSSDSHASQIGLL
jgi:hypothetical protein